MSTPREAPVVLTKKEKKKNNGHLLLLYVNLYLRKVKSAYNLSGTFESQSNRRNLVNENKKPKVVGAIIFESQFNILIL